MSSNLLRKYIDIINEVSPPGWGKTVEKMKKHTDIDNPFALAWSMKKKGYTPHYKEETEVVDEKWGEPTQVSASEKGKYAGKTKAELLKSYNALKNSGPHSKGSPEFERQRELAFAIRAKGGWGKVE
jgi:hypothetical protein